MRAFLALCGRALREPLIHFLAIGATLFGAYFWFAADRADSNRIVITPGQVDALIAIYTRTWQHPPDDAELKAQLDDFVREEIATREAIAMGLDRGDTVVRRRLRQKLEAMVVDITLDTSEESDAALQAWLDARADQFRREPRVAFRQVYLSPRRRGAALAEDAVALREQLVDASPDVNIERLGDPLMLPGDVALSGAQEVARLFGEEFTREVLTLTPGKWDGPVRSSYGLHVVFLRERVTGGQPTLAEVRPQVERLFAAARRQQKLEEMYGTLLEKYQVVVEPRPKSSP
ncbi:MAG: peptidyl-prolyl cis-trans isomerase [Inquilinus sp.]|uniref:peptidylprolyl isomerase n=1 Tax=Inquilinus sp. TaxID=1932117 RepID=UPI003F2AF992